MISKTQEEKEDKNNVQNLMKSSKKSSVQSSKRLKSDLSRPSKRQCRVFIGENLHCIFVFNRHEIDLRRSQNVGRWTFYFHKSETNDVRTMLEDMMRRGVAKYSYYTNFENEKISNIGFCTIESDENDLKSQKAIAEYLLNCDLLNDERKQILQFRPGNNVRSVPATEFLYK